MLINDINNLIEETAAAAIKPGMSGFTKGLLGAGLLGGGATAALTAYGSGLPDSYLPAKVPTVSNVANAVKQNPILPMNLNSLWKTNNGFVAGTHQTPLQYYNRLANWHGASRAAQAAGRIGGQFSVY